MLGGNLTHFSPCELKYQIVKACALGSFVNERSDRIETFLSVEQVLVILSCSNVVCYYNGDPQTSKSDCGATKDGTEGKSHQGV